MLLCYHNECFYLSFAASKCQICEVMGFGLILAVKLLLYQMEMPNQLVENLMKEPRDIPIGALNLWMHLL